MMGGRYRRTTYFVLSKLLVSLLAMLVQKMLVLATYKSVRYPVTTVTWRSSLKYLLNWDVIMWADNDKSLRVKYIPNLAF